MQRRERRSTPSEAASTVPFQGTLTPGDILGAFSDQQGVDGSFPAQDSGFAHVVIIRRPAPQIASRNYTSVCGGAVIRKRLTALDKSEITGQMFFDIAIGKRENRHSADNRNQPSGIVDAQF